MTTYADVGMDDPGVRDMVANAVLRTELGGPLMVSDLPPGADEPAGVACLFGDDEGGAGALASSPVPNLTEWEKMTRLAFERDTSMKDLIVEAVEATYPLP